MFRSTTQNGLLIGILLSLKFLLSTQETAFFSILALSISILIIITLYRLGLRFRENENGGDMTYKKAFNYVFLTYLFGAIISSLIILIYTRIYPNYIDYLLEKTLQMYDRYNFQIDESTYDMFQRIYKPAPYALMNIFSSSIVGAFWGLILATFLKNEKSIFGDNPEK